MSQSDPKFDPKFDRRVEAIIQLCNAQMAGEPQTNMVATSAAFAAARFAVWVTANMTMTEAEFQAMRKDTVANMTEGFRQMLEQHYDEVAQNYDTYLNHQPGVVTR